MLSFGRQTITHMFTYMHMNPTRSSNVLPADALVAYWRHLVKLLYTLEHSIEQTNSIVDTQSMSFSCLDAHMMAAYYSPRVIEAILIGIEYLLKSVEPSTERKTSSFFY